MILAVTGHRPDKLGGYGVDARMLLLRTAKTWIHTNKPELVYTGMALGWDQVIAEACIYYGVNFIACIPFKDQERIWPKASQYAYKELLSGAKEVVIVSPGQFAAWKMQKRNEYMVDRADTILTVWDGTRGGTDNCLAYAGNQNKHIINLYDLLQMGDLI